METSPLAQALANPPAFAPFLAVVLAALYAVAALAFAMRRHPAAGALRGALDQLVAMLLAGMLLAMVFLSALQILLRNAFDTGLLWVDPLLRHFVLFLAMLGGLVATGRKRHIQINVLERLLQGSARRVAGVVVAAAASVICTVVAHASFALLRDEVGAPGPDLFGLPSWGMLLAIPAGFLALALRFAYLAFLEAAGEAPRAEDLPDELRPHEARG